MIISSGSNNLTSSFLPSLTSEQQERKLSCHAIYAESCPFNNFIIGWTYLNMFLSCRHILCSSFSTTHFRSSCLSLDENFVTKAIHFFNFVVVTSNYHCPRIKDKFPNYALCTFAHQIL